MKIMVVILSFAILFASLCAESFDEKLQRLSEEAAKGYVQPLVTSFGTNLNSGLFNTAEVLKPSILRPIRFGFGFHAMIAFVPDADKTFKAADPFNPNDTVTTATVFGDKGYTYENPIYPDSPVRVYPDGLDISMVPLIIPQFRFGLPKGNELMIRYLPPFELGDYGDIQFWGVGLKHSIDQYIPLFPIHLAVQGAYQALSVGDVVDITSIAINAQASKRILMWTFYGGLGWESTKLKAEYDYNPYAGHTLSQDKISFDITGDNNVRMTLGFRYAIIPFVHLNADYTISNYNAATVGLGMSF